MVGLLHKNLYSKQVRNMQETVRMIFYKSKYKLFID